MHKLPNEKYMASRKNAKDDWCKRQSAKRSRLFLMFISAFVDPQKGVSTLRHPAKSLHVL